MPEPTDPQAALQKLLKEVLELAGIENYMTLPRHDHAMWFPWGYEETDPKRARVTPTLIKPGVGLPMSAESSFFTFGLFQDETEIRVYAMQSRFDLPPLAQPTSPLRRYKFSRTSPTFFCESMTMEVFKQALADEWSQIATGMTTAEQGRAEVVEFLEDQPDFMTVKEVLAKIDAGDLEGDEEDQGDAGPSIVAEVLEGTGATASGAQDKPS